MKAIPVRWASPLSTSLALTFFGLTCFMPSGSAQSTSPADDMHWVATWASSQQQPRAPQPPRPALAAAPASPAPSPPPAPTAAPAPPATPAPPAPRPPASFNNQTVRMILRTSLGGNRLRVHLSNAFGAAPLKVGAAHIALHAKGSAIIPASDRVLSFNGKPSVTVPVGAEMLSDPLSLDVAPLTELAVSVFIPSDSGPASTHSLGLHTTYIAAADTTSAPELTDATTSQAWYFVSGVDVLASPESATIVAFGDSITDGATSTPDTDHSWPSLLSKRLQANSATANIAIVNQGISGNRVLSDGAGVSALARFDRDVLAQPGVKWLTILEGINDMNLATRPVPGVAPITADDLIGAMKQMIERAHSHGIKVIGCTLTPFGNATDAVEAMRQALNQFIRTSGSFDSVVDFDKVIRDPASERQFRQGYNNTDKLHPNDAGYQAMADAIDLSLFNTRSAARPASSKSGDQPKP